MITFAEGDEGGNDVVTGRVAVVKGLVAEPVGEGVDAEGGLLDEEDAEDTAVDESAEPVTPAQTADQHGKDEAHEEDDLEVVTMLPDDHGVLVEVRDISTADSLRVLLHQHPAKVRIQETLANRVWVFVGIGVSVLFGCQYSIRWSVAGSTHMSPVVTSPPSDRALNSPASHSCEEYTERSAGGI